MRKPSLSAAATLFRCSALYIYHRAQLEADLSTQAFVRHSKGVSANGQRLASCILSRLQNGHGSQRDASLFYRIHAAPLHWVDFTYAFFCRVH